MRIVNTYKETRVDWYSWTVSIEGTDEELNEIKYVTYLLHKTFPGHRVVATDPTNNFARTFEGWGEFLLKAKATMKDGEEYHAKLWLDLGFEDTADKKEKYTGEFSKKTNKSD